MYSKVNNKLVYNILNRNIILSIYRIIRISKYTI